MRIRFDHPTAARIEFQPGDELTVATLPPAIEALLNSPRMDGSRVVRIIADDETADIDTEQQDTAALRHGRQRGHRTEAVRG